MIREDGLAASDAGEEQPDSGGPVVDRRGLLLGLGALAFGELVPRKGDAAAPEEPWRGEPFDDGSYFDDGYGWVA